MALDGTYAGLQTTIANELHRADLTNYIPDWILQADSEINGRLRVRQMETTTASTMAAGVLAVPANYIEMKDCYISSSTPYRNLDRKTSNWIYDKYPYRTKDSIPEFIGREGSNFIFGPFPDADYVVTLVYYNRFPSLSSAVNAIFTTYQSLWFYGSLIHSAPWLKNDPRIQVWRSEFERILNVVQKESDDEYYSGAPLEMAPL